MKGGHWPQNSCKNLILGAFDHAPRAPQLQLLHNECAMHVCVVMVHVVGNLPIKTLVARQQPTNYKS